MRILKDQSIGLVIDIQERLFPFIHEHETLARHSGILVQGLTELGLPILVTEQYTKGLGPTVSSLKPLLPQPVIEKMAFSCCDEPLFRAALAESGRKFVIITGIESHVCVLQTAIDLLDLNYVPVIVEDCVSSRRLNDKQQAVARMRKAGAIVTTYESVLFELLRYSGTDEFRAISKLVK